MKFGIDLCEFTSIHAGGKDEQAYNILRGLRDLGYSDHIVCFCHQDIAPIVKEIDEKFEICVLPKWQLKGPLKTISRIFRGLYQRKEVKKRNVDALLFTNKLTPVLRYPTKTAVLVNDMQIFEAGKIPGITTTKRYYIETTALIKLDFMLRDYIVEISDFDIDEIRRFAPWAVKKTHRIHCPIRFPEEKFERGEGRYITALNIQWEHKNVGTLIRAFAQIVGMISQSLILVGKKPENYEELMQYIREQGLEDRITFTGFVTDEELTSIMKQTRIYVNPSFYEGFGMTAVEMMGRGIPTIAAGVASIPEVTQHLCRYYSPADDAQALAQQIVEELENPATEGELQKIAEKMKNSYSYKIIAQQYYDFLKKIVISGNQKLSSNEGMVQ